MKEIFKKVLANFEEFGLRMASWTYLAVIRDAFTDLLPLIITGSFAVLINNVLCSPTNGIAQYAGFEFLTQFSPIFNAVNYATMNFIAIYLVYRIAHKMAEVRQIAPILAGFVALASFVSLLPTVAAGKSATDEVVNIANVLASKYTNAQGMFLAIIIGIASIELFNALIKSGKFNIKMPESVPTGVSRSFAVLFPSMITILVFGLVGFLFTKFTGTVLPDFITKTLQTPMEAIMQHPAGVIVLVMVAQIFWLFGIHGAQMISPVRTTIGLAAIAQNLAAYEAGLALPNVFTFSFWNTYGTIGGSGNTIGLIVAIFLLSKRADHKSIAKLSAVPAVFGINEPMIFGVPIVFNPLLAVPFILAPVVTAAMGYFATSIGFAQAAIMTVPFTVPPLINAYLSTAGSIGAVITQFAGIIVSILIYLPFVKFLNDQKIESV